MYARGDGVAQDDVEAVRLYRLAAAQGVADAQCDLGKRYKEGAGVAQDSVEAARLFRQAAAQGHAHGQGNLGYIYANGDGVAQDFVEAARLWRLAAGQGNVHACKGLSDLQSEREYVSACCTGCGATRKLKTCARCKVARFCGAECARRAWPEHKPHCKRWETEAAAGDER
jgi:TPR repeat protein